MNSDRWQKVTEAFDAVLEYPPGERNSYLQRTCSDDHELLIEVVRLLAEFENAGDFLELPVATPRRGLLPGDLVAGRYLLEILLGRGGMGEVYRAHDELMDELVALKTMLPELAVNQSLIRRFRREVQLARKIAHPNVCRVFDVGVHTESGRQVHFFTMQLLEGETLAARIRRSGRLSKEEGFPLAVQMAKGLNAAHQAGVIHRDFKSANVILCSGNAVITDFGLARFEPQEGSPEPVGTITANAQVAGTVAYMSPEQLSGGKVTLASDIYSLGVVLFEMATGQLPFDDSHIIQSAMQRASDSAPDVHRMAPRLEPQWAAAITRCLQRDPSKRFDSALDVAGYLQPSAWRFPTTYWTRRQWVKAATVAGVSAVSMALVPVVSRFYPQDARLPTGAEALLNPINNSTGDARFDGITELFRNQLSQSAHLNLIEARSLAGALRQMGKAEDTTDPAAVREAAWRLNAALSVFGNVSRIGTDYALNIQIETRGSQPNAPRVKSLRSFSAPDPDALMRSVRDASVWIRETVGESPSNIASFDRLPADATTPSWEALSVYARGQQFFIHQEYEPALLEFETALRIDPKFTLAALRRADLLVSRGRQTEGFSKWRAAIRMLDQRPVTRTEELNARSMFAFDSGNIDDNDKLCRTWSLEYPSDWRGPYFRIIGLILSGHAAQALEILTLLRRMMPDFGDLYAQTIAAHLVLGQTEQARAFVPELRKRNYSERADLREGFVRFREGNCTGYLEILRAIQRSKNRRAAADATLHEAMLCIDAQLPAAVSGLVESFLSAGSWVETVPEQSQLRIVQAWGEMLSGRHAAAILHARRALDLESGPLIVTLAGVVFARTGAKQLARQALKLCEDLVDLNLYKIAYHRITGQLALSAGDTDSAIVEFRAASRLEPAIAHRQYLIEALPPSSPERLELCLNVVRVPWQALRPPPLHSLGSLSVAVPAINTGGPHEPFAQRFAESSDRLAKVIQ